MADDTPRVFTTEINGKRVNRVANRPAEVVKFVFDGWTEVKPAEAKKTAAAIDRDVAASEKAQAAADKAAATEAKK
jgi:hypothetical protein